MLSKCLGKKVIFKEMSRKESNFQGITREIRNFSENNYFRIIIFVSNNFVSEGISRGFLRPFVLADTHSKFLLLRSH